MNNFGTISTKINAEIRAPCWIKKSGIRKRGRSRYIESEIWFWKSCDLLSHCFLRRIFYAFFAFLSDMTRLLILSSSLLISSGSFFENLVRNSISSFICIDKLLSSKSTFPGFLLMNNSPWKDGPSDIGFLRLTKFLSESIITLDSKVDVLLDSVDVHESGKDTVVLLEVLGTNLL